MSVTDVDTRSKHAFILRTCRELEELGVPEYDVSPILEYAATLLCEGCGNAATSGPHGPDGVYLCDLCLAVD